MKVLIDISPLIQSEWTGIAHSIAMLCEALSELGANDEFLLWAANLRRNPLPERPGRRFVGRGLVRVPRRLLATLGARRALPRAVFEADVFHQPFVTKPYPQLASVPLVTTLNDLCFVRHPESVHDENVLRALHEIVPQQLAASDRIITISNSTARDAQEIYGIAPDTIRTVYLGSDLRAPSEAERTRARARLQSRGLPARYVLFVGTWEPRKNLQTLFRAVARLRAKLREREVFLCVAGAQGWKGETAERVLEELNLGELVVRLGYVPREDLATLYYDALLFAYPSFYEGFGLPVLEALACGCPVVTSNASSLPEVAGEAAILIDPNDADALAGAIESLLDDPARRARMAQMGLEQAAKFSWERCARETMEVYRLSRALPAPAQIGDNQNL